MENKDYEDDVDDNYNPEEEVTGGDWKIEKRDLPEVQIVTGEEQEEEVTNFRTKLYRWRDAQWKERGTGDLKLLKNKESQKIRVLMRQDKTKKIVANFLITGQAPLCQLTPQKTTDKAWVVTAYDCSEDEPQIEKLCIRLTSVDEFKRFQTEFENAYKANQSDEKKEEKSEEKTEEKEQEKKEE
ncbi:hypothetical protein PPERSA_12861 [Pseudocohnilembus persalinus]|uniref:RanBD1 domain-containing protein n=1 Tax=Pseudocohnilembus persalinus TaxID=266149 RepID=A0A0V0Q864_PSEPJ|nr:hypothetical protein PPERSA_12861 [Pseudocohnilembus persalinus]|eukprot:KRW98382.1 hypothetical protein PPERSA_12861 [Pseudocohnilembus persalinus]